MFWRPITNVISFRDQSSYDELGKKHLNFDCFITCLYEGPFFFWMTPFIDYMSPIGI